MPPCSEDLLFQIPAWPHIFSYLTLADLETFGQVHWKLKEILNGYQKSPIALVVDQDTLRRFPMDSNRDVYLRYHMTTEMELNGVLEPFLKKLFRHFPNIDNLTLRHMDIRKLYRDEDIPSFLHKLSLVNSCIRPDFLKCFSMSSLHLEGNESIELDYNPYLKSLTLINQTVTYGVFPYPMLEQLTIDYCWKAFEYDDVKKFSDLEALKVLRSVDWKTMSQIEALQLKSVEVQHYFQVPTQENLVLTLNDDCLYHLQSFLPLVDWTCLSETHPRFQNLRISAIRVNE